MTGITVDITANKCDSNSVISNHMTGFGNSKLSAGETPFLFCTCQFLTACVSSGFRPTGLLLSRVAKLDAQAVSVLANKAACFTLINRSHKS